MTSGCLEKININGTLVTVASGLLLYTLRVAAQDQGFRFDPEAGMRNSALGKVPDGAVELEVNVLDADAQPAIGTRIEVRTVTGSAILSKEIGNNGWVQISDLQPGWYEVAASLGTHRTEVTVRLSFFAERLTLHLDSTVPRDSRQNMVSVHSLAVPSKARKEFETADRLFHKNDIPGAWNHVEKALQISSKYPPALTLRGLLEISEQRLQEAMGDLSAAVAEDRGYQLAYVGLAAGHNAMGQFDEALRVLDQGNTLASPMWLAHLQAGIARLGKQDFRRALAEAGEAQNLLGKDLPVLHLLKGFSYIGLNDVTSARLELRQYLRKHSTGPDADKARATLTSLRDDSGPGVTSVMEADRARPVVADR